MDTSEKGLKKFLFSFCVTSLLVLANVIIFNGHFLLFFLVFFPLFLSAGITKTLPTLINTLLFSSSIVWFFSSDIYDQSFIYYIYTFLASFMLFVPIIFFAYWSNDTSLAKINSIRRGTVFGLLVVCTLLSFIFLQAIISYITHNVPGFYVPLRFAGYNIAFSINYSHNTIFNEILLNPGHIIDLFTIVLPSVIIIFITCIVWSSLKLATDIINNRNNYKTITIKNDYYLPTFYNIIFIIVLSATTIMCNFIEIDNLLLYTLLCASFTLWLGYAYCGIYYIKSYIVKQHLFILIVLIVIFIIFFAELIALASFIGFFVSIKQYYKKSDYTSI